MPYQPKTGAACGCKRGIQRDNCPNCEGTGQVIDFAAIRARSLTPTSTSTLQTEHDASRKQYLNNERSHDEHYLWLADAIGITIADLPVNLERINKSTDEHLNDIALRLWDDRHGTVRHKATQAGMRAWSLSDTVCVLKAYARRAGKLYAEGLITLA